MRVMSECDGEQTARSVALEQAYVHEVYEQCAEKTAQSRQWPRIYEFLEELEPGALVCDIGCGNGKYLNVNNSIFKVGADRCKKLTDIARGKENEVLICDNLALPFRDESFDAVLSIAVVHHFATTERRVNALKELARVLRIGGKLVISVWAMEQRHRKFESQDVLIPWPKAYCLNSTCNCEIDVPCMIDPRRSHKLHKCILTSRRIEKQKSKNKGYWIDPIFSPSPSTSSLSSPNETCYSFFRRALQKLAGGKRCNSTNCHNRSWFLESFNNNDCKNHHYHCEQDDCTDVDDIPIELRRLEDENIISNKPNDTLSIKSKSLGDIFETQRLNLVRSRSSIPGLCSTITSKVDLNEESISQITIDSSKPRLVKQKTHLIDNTCTEFSESTAMRELFRDLPELSVNTIATTNLSVKRANVQKQSSMNEELMSMERLVERERVRCNIMKQASLNEEIICKRSGTLENFKDSLSSGITTRRFQMLKSGLTNRIKMSTTSMEKVASISIKNGFVKIFQGWTSADSNACNDNERHPDNLNDIEIEKHERASVQSTAITPTTKEPNTVERRLSKEDGSDSSKDSSLQSDTSVDSEDSFASVIYIPKKEPAPPLIDITNSAIPCSYQLRTTSAPPSPRVKHPPDLRRPKLKVITISPLLKQFSATSKSLPPPSPPGLSPKTINFFNTRPFFGSNCQNNLNNNYDQCSMKTIIKTAASIPSGIDEKSIKNDGSMNLDGEINTVDNENVIVVQTVQSDSESTSKHEKIVEIMENISKKSNTEIFENYKTMSNTVHEQDETMNINDSLPLLSNNDMIKQSSIESINDENSRRSRLNQIKELLKQKPGFATRCAKPAFPLVRRASTASAGRLETVARTLPRLLSLDLFNPETDDLDSDSSGVSSPDSVGSIISVITDERFIINKENSNVEDSLESSKEMNVQTASNNHEKTTSLTDEITSSSSSSSQSVQLLEAAANVTSSLESAMEAVIQVHSESRDFPENHAKNNVSLQINDIDHDNTWSEACRQHLIDFTEKLGENLIQDIDQYCQKVRLEYNDMDINRSNEKKNANDVNVMENSNSNCKYSDLIDNTIAWLRGTTGNNDRSGYDNKSNDIDPLTKSSQVVVNQGDESLYNSSSSEDTMDFVMVSKNGEIEESVTNITKNSLINCENDKYDGATKKKCVFKHGNSLESSDNGDSIDNTISLSDDSSKTKRLCSASTASLGSVNVEYDDSIKNKRKYQYGRRSISAEITSDTRKFNKIENDDFSESSSSQESLPSDHGGGAITYHQYYHVFREGELDQLINKYVENLHIISSYYDHANWCIVAEKVQVWTI